MKHADLKIGEIQPFVRHFRYFTITSDTLFVDIKAYDYRLLYVANGKSAIKIGNELYSASVGDIFIIPPGVSYSYLPEPENPIRFYGVNFDYTLNGLERYKPIEPESISVFKEENIVEKVAFADVPEMNGVVYLTDMSETEALFNRINRELENKKRFSELAVRGIFTEIISAVAGKLVSDFSVQEKSGGLVKKVIAYIQDNITADLSNDSLGKLFNFDPTYISRCFVKYTGMSLHKYVMRYRVLCAIDLLQNTDYSISEIALFTGFNSAGYFCRIFKQNVGVQPSEYRV